MRSILLAFVLTGATQASTTITETFSNSTSTAIPDGDLNGLVQTLTPATTIGTVNSITVTLNVSGGWNGDLYAYLWHDGQISILVNRPGRTSGNLAGIAGSGLSVTLEDAGVTDMHAALASFGNPVTGTYQPDGRAIHPLNVLDTTPRTAPLSVFSGSAATGDWRLFIADVATGDTATLTSWSVSITGTAVPEPGSAGLFALGALLAINRRKRTE